MTRSPRPGPERGSTLAVVLAAGGGTRFVADTHKLLTPLDGMIVVERCLRAAIESEIGPVLVVTGAVPLPEAVAGRLHLRQVHNDRWRQGQATSLATAIAVATEGDYEAIVVGLGDQPLVPAEAWRRVAASDAPIAVAEYGGVRRNPVRLHRSVWPLLDSSGDEGARSVIRMRPDLVEPVPCSGSSADIDTVADLERLEEQLQWQSRSSTNSP